MSLVENLEKLSNAYGVAGREDEVRELLRQMLSPHVDEVKEDKMGNLVGIIRGKSEHPKIMVAAHMDEVGLLVKNITREGFLQFAKIGGIDDRILIAREVVVLTDRGLVKGVIGSKPPHILKEEERKKVIEASDLFIDVGASSKEEVEQMGIKVGDFVAFDLKFWRLKEDVVVGKAFDDRAGCAALVEVAKALWEQKEKLRSTVYLVGTIQEEVGLRGAATATYSIYPDVGLAIDTAIAGDVPGVKEAEAPIKLGKGPALTVADAGLITSPKLLRVLIEAAEESKIPYQLESGTAGTTDAARMAITREGVLSSVIAIPTRYIHSPASILKLSDLENAVRLTLAAIEKIQQKFA